MRVFVYKCILCKIYVFGYRKVYKVYSIVFIMINTKREDTNEEKGGVEKMGKENLEIPILHRWVCEKCGHKWIPRNEERPRVCPRCKSAWWDIPSETENVKNE